MILNTQANRERNNSDDNMIPLINVVFLMLIFFMVAGHIAPSDGVTVAPPVSLSDSQSVSEQLKVVVAKDGQVFIDGLLIDEHDITQRVLTYSNAIEFKENSAILVKADAELEVEILQKILKHIKAAGISRLSLVTSQVKA